MAQVTGKDARDILSIPEGGGGGAASSNAGPSSSSSSRPPAGPPTHSSSHKHRSKPKIDGITRELHALLGDNAPSIAVAHHDGGGDEGQQGSYDLDPSSASRRPKFVKRRDRKVRGWEQAAFRNPARKDDLVLKHWVARDDQQDRDDIEDGMGDSSESAALAPRRYGFAKFNASSGVYSYTNDEYTQHLRDDDWTKDETDHLMELCAAYDLRFVVIADRWEMPRARSIEDLKARYYAICRRLIRNRVAIEDVDARQQLLATYQYDKPREVERKRMLARLFQRTPAQLAEEEALYVEARRIEQNEAKFAADREDLLKLLGGWERVPDVTRGSIADAGAGVGRLGGVIPGSPGAMEESLNESKRAKKRRLDAASDGGGAGGAAAAAAASPSLGSVAPPPPLTAKRRQELRSAQHDEMHNITRFDPEFTPLSRPAYPYLVGVASNAPPTAPSPHNPSSSHGVYLRSARVLTPRATQLNRTNQSLAELTPPIGPRLVFPTRQNCEKWEGLLGAVTSGLEMKKQTDRVESELRVAKNRLAALLGKGSASAAGAAGGLPPAAAAGGSSALGGSSSVPTSATPAAAAAATRGRSSTPRSVRGMSRSRTPAAAAVATPASATEQDSNTAVGDKKSSKKNKKQSVTAGLVGHDDDDDDDDEEEKEEEGEDEEEEQAGDEGDGNDDADDKDDSMDVDD